MEEHLFLHPTANLKSLVVWDMERQQALGQLEGHDRRIDIVTARGSMAVSCQRSGPMTARVWSLETMQCIATLASVPDGISTFSACCAEGRVLLGQGDGGIRVWDIATSAPVALADLEGHALVDSVVFDVKTTAAGSIVLSGSWDKTVRLWDLRTNRCVRTMQGHSREVWSVDMDGHSRTAVSGSDDCSVKLWDLGSGRCMETYECRDRKVTDVVMHESGSSFMSYGLNIVNAWATGSTRAIMRADVTSFYMHDDASNASCRLFASRDLLTVAFCSIRESQMGLSVWK